MKQGEKCRILALYLPQFHETIENSKNWGEGYTEWTAVKNAKPYYKGHKQPKKPLNNNYYDLSDETGEVWKWQSELAGRYGIYGFVIYHYWFSGYMPLHKPLEILLAHPEINVHYSLCWDSNSWKRNWFGVKDDILIKQDYGDHVMWERHFADLLPFFQDERYIKLDNKPVFHIHNSRLVPCFSEMIDCFHKLAVQNGFDGIYWVGGDYSGRNEESGLDAYYNFEPNHIQMSGKHAFFLRILRDTKGGIRNRLNRIFHCHLLDIRSSLFLLRLIVKEKSKRGQKMFRGIYVSYDDSPRRWEKGIIYRGCTPQRFFRALYKLLCLSYKENSEFLYINAWNEWGEGAYLEPDEENEYAYLEAVARAVTKAEPRS